MAGRSDKTPSSYDEILRRTVVNTDTSMRPSREEEMLSFNDHIVTLHDMPALTRLAEFEPAYLNNR